MPGQAALSCIIHDMFQLLQARAAAMSGMHLRKTILTWCTYSSIQTCHTSDFVTASSSLTITCVIFDSSQQQQLWQQQQQDILYTTVVWPGSLF